MLCRIAYSSRMSRVRVTPAPVVLLRRVDDKGPPRWRRALHLGARHLFEIRMKRMAAVRRMAELLEHLRLDLADALARDAELFADFFQGSIAPIIQAVAQLDDLALTLG